MSYVFDSALANALEISDEACPTHILTSMSIKTTDRYCQFILHACTTTFHLLYHANAASSLSITLRTHHRD